MSLRAQRDQKRRRNGCRERDEAGTETRGGQEHGIQPRVGGRGGQDGGGAAQRPQGAPSARAEWAHASPRSVDLALKTVESLLKTGPHCHRKLPSTEGKSEEEGDRGCQLVLRPQCGQTGLSSGETWMSSWGPGGCAVSILLSSGGSKVTR